jgi:AcrR family transcriptional regulator
MPSPGSPAAPAGPAAPSGSAVQAVRSRLPAARRRSQLLDAAAALLARDGAAAEAVTMDAVAAQAGVSKALVYRYFDNADALLLALAAREMSQVAEQVRAAMERAVTFEESIRASLAAWFDVLTERGGVVVALLGAPALAGSLGERRRALRSMIGDNYATRATSAYRLDPELATVATTILLAGLDGLIDCWVERRAPRRQLVDIYTTMCLAAYQALAEQPPVIGDLR